MLATLIRAILMVLVAASLVACGDDGNSGGDESSDPQPEPEVSVPASTEAMTVLFRTMLEDIRSGNDKRVTETLKGMTLSEPEAFFAEHFPKEIADKLAEDYPATAEHLPEVAAVLRSQLDKGRDQVLVEKFDAPDDAKAVGYQAAALKKMTKKTALYSVRLSAEDQERGFHLWSFVHDGKRFRWVGKLSKVLSKVDKRKDELLQLRVEQAAQLSKR